MAEPLPHYCARIELFSDLFTLHARQHALDASHRPVLEATLHATVERQCAVRPWPVYVRTWVRRQQIHAPDCRFQPEPAAAREPFESRRWADGQHRRESRPAIAVPGVVADRYQRI